MARLTLSGTSIVTPVGDFAALTQALSDLHVGEAFNETAAQEVYWKLGAIIGRWMSEQSRLETSSLAKALLTTAKNLGEASVLLGGLETGVHSDIEIAVSSRAAQYLALDPDVGSVDKAQSTDCFIPPRSCPNCSRSHGGSCRPFQSGQRSGAVGLFWYDDFTALLLDIANKAGVKPTLRKDRITGVRGGWLFEAAQVLESFLWPDMRSQSPEAREVAWIEV